MPRPRNADALNPAQPVTLTRPAIDRMACPPDKLQVFFRDKLGNGLRVRVTRTGRKTFVFEQSLKNRTIRKPIGAVESWDIEDAQAEARRLAVLLDSGTDPRDLDREGAERKAREKAEADAKAAEAEAHAAAQAAQAAAEALTVGEVWGAYIAERRPHWGDRTYADHLGMTDAGGRERKRLAGVATKPGPLAPLMARRLVDLDAKAIEAWAIEEAKTRPARVRLALRLLKAFLRWAAAEPHLSDKVDPTAASARKAREAAGKAKPKDDVLERGQLSAWFAAVRGIPNAVTAAYLQTLLLTGGRPGEVLALRWQDINTQWKSIAIRDKVEGERQIPLTPYVWSLLAALPRRNQWVFSSARAISLDPRHIQRRERYHDARGTVAPVGDAAQASESGRLVEPGYTHRQACAAAGLAGLTLHGLRRSFASLTEWLEIPAGVVAQIMGHKPSATAEKHYKRRPLDLLRVHHERIERWILEAAGVVFDCEAAATSAAPALRVVAST